MTGTVVNAETHEMSRKKPNLYFLGMSLAVSIEKLAEVLPAWK
jgi:hypothetical protein